MALKRPLLLIVAVAFLLTISTSSSVAASTTFQKSTVQLIITNEAKTYFNPAVTISHECNASIRMQLFYSGRCPNSTDNGVTGKWTYSLYANSNYNQLAMYDREIDRTGLNPSSLPSGDWLINVAGNDKNKSVSSKDGITLNEGGVTKIDMRTSYTVPANTSGSGNNNTGAAGVSGNSSTPNSTSGPLTIGFNAYGIPTVGIDASRCPTGSTVYTSGILKGVPCDGTLKTLDETLIIVKNIVQGFLLPLIGVIFIIMLLIGGIMYITSRGNQTQLDRAKKTLTAAIIGLLIVTLSYTLIAIFANLIGGGIA